MDIIDRVRISVIAYASCPKSWGQYGPQPKDRLILIDDQNDDVEQGWYTTARVLDGFFGHVPGIQASGEARYLDEATADARKNLLVVLLAADRSAMTESQRNACDEAIAEIQGAS